MDVRPVTVDRLADLAALFGTAKVTTNCALAYDDDGTPAGWLATGPRSRYARAVGPRTRILRDRDPDEDDDVWLLPCFFVRVGHRRQGVTDALLAAAVAAASEHGATAVEGFPIAAGRPTSADAYLGTERRFTECGFDCIARPSEHRVVMRRNLGGVEP